MRLNIFFWTVFLFTHHAWVNTQQPLESAANLIFGRTGLNIKPQQVQIIEKLELQILRASMPVLRYATTIIVQQLTTQLYKLEEHIKSIDENQKQVPSLLFFQRYILNQRLNHFKNYFGLDEQTVGQWIQQHLQYGYQRFLTLLGRESKINLEEARLIAQQVLQYFEIENTILINYDRLLHFLALLKHYSLPHFMLVWDTPHEIENLKKHAIQIKPEVKIQLIETIISFAVQGLLMGGGGAALQIEDKATRDAYENAQAQQGKIESAWEIFQKQIFENQKKIIDTLSAAFSKSSQEIQTQYKKDQERLSAESIYLAQSINQAKPRDQLIAYPIQSDLQFTHAAMLTPNPRLPWYNIYNIFQRGVDWQYNVETNSFWQYGNASFPKEVIWNMKPEDADIARNDPASFSIFTEYIDSKNQYDIEIDCFLSPTSYPFFAGVIFNRGRWISGAPERLWQYRLVGIYGNETKTINIGFGQQTITPAVKEKTPEKITSPLEHIITKPESRVYQFTDAERNELDSKPILFTFKITTSPQSALITVSRTSIDLQGKQTVVQLISKAIPNLNDFDFIFHGIGFIAVGCQAEFKIRKPTQLAYRPEEIIEYEKRIMKKGA